MNSNDPGAGNRAGRWLRTAAATVVGNLYLFLGTLFFSCVAILATLFPQRSRWVSLVAKWWSRGLLWTSGVRVETSFEEQLASGGPFVFMANHQSLFDIPVLLATVPVETRMLAKRSLFRIPIFGWSMKLGGFIAIDREDGSRAADNFAEAVETLKGGMSALVFPEGTRSLDARVAGFKRGGFLLALKSGLPIVPVGVENTAAVRLRGSLVNHPRRVHVRYGVPIEVGGYTVRQRRELMATVRGEIVTLANCSEAQ